jgi:hypothetical protein
MLASLEEQLLYGNEIGASTRVERTPPARHDVFLNLNHLFLKLKMLSV